MEATGVLGVATPDDLGVRDSVSMEKWGNKAWEAGEESNGYDSKWTSVTRATLCFERSGINRIG